MNSDLEYRIRGPEAHALGKVPQESGGIGLELEERVQGGDNFLGSHSHRTNGYVPVMSRIR